MIHNRSGVGITYPRKYVMLCNSGAEYIIEGTDDINAGYRAINLAGLLDEELKDVIPCDDNEQRKVFTWGDYEKEKET